MQELLQTIRDEFYSRLQARKTDEVARNYRFIEIKDKARVAIGVRRCGKTHFLYQIINQLLESGVEKDQIFIINFEDDRVLPCDKDKLVEILESFYSMYPDNHKRKCYIFLDEIQNVEGWARVVRRFLDTKDLDIYLSGSSAKLLSKDIHTSLRGRSLALEIWPFSLREYLAASNYELSEPPYSKRVQDELKSLLQNYLVQGGFPGVFNLQAADRKSMLQDYIELVTIKDIVERYNIDNLVLLKYLIQNLLRNVGSMFSANKFSNDLKSQGMRGSKSTVLDYMQYLEDAFLIFPVPMYSESVRKMQSNHRKIYAVDTGLVDASVFSVNSNLGHLFENIFYLYLRRHSKDIYYYLTEQGRYEVDFLSRDVDGRLHLYQVCWDTSDAATLARERRALDIACRELNAEGTIVTPELMLQKYLD